MGYRSFIETSCTTNIDSWLIYLSSTWVSEHPRVHRRIKVAFAIFDQHQIDHAHEMAEWTFETPVLRVLELRIYIFSLLWREPSFDHPLPAKLLSCMAYVFAVGAPEC